MGFLRSYRGALLVVSHDIELLDESIARVMHLDEGTLVEYKGTYSQYRDARRQGRGAQGQGGRAPDGGDQATVNLADSMRHQTEKRARPPRPWTNGWPGCGPPRPRTQPGDRRYQVSSRAPHSGRVVIEAEGLAKAYGGPPVFEDVTFAVERGQRLLVMGLNGAGKTSLLRILAGLAPYNGSWRSGVGVCIGYYAQEHEGIVAGRSVLDHVRDQSGTTDTELRSLLGMFGLVGEKAFQDASTLSGGEKTKLALSQLVAGRHNCLLLDEPTNNLDPPSREGIGRALSAWPGRHDRSQPRRWLRERAGARPGVTYAGRDRRRLGRRAARPRHNGVTRRSGRASDRSSNRHEDSGMSLLWSRRGHDLDMGKPVMSTLGAPIVSFDEFNMERPPGRIVATSGGYDPVHPGHVSSIQDSHNYGDIVVVIVNGDAFLAAKKGKAFQDLQTRCL